MTMYKALFAALCCTSAFAYTAEDRENVLKDIIDAEGYPRLEAWNKMTPKHFKTMMTAYGATLAPDAFEYFTAEEAEVIYAAVSSVNNCELCLSFHAMTLGGQKKPTADIKEIVAGGLPKDPEMRKLVIGAKYALAHKGIFLEREKLHLATMGIEGEKLVELNFLVGMMSAFNMNYIHLISNGLELEPMLHEVGPFADTVYASKKEL